MSKTSKFHRHLPQPVRPSSRHPNQKETSYVLYELVNDSFYEFNSFLRRGTIVMHLSSYPHRFDDGTGEEHQAMLPCWLTPNGVSAGHVPEMLVRCDIIRRLSPPRRRGRCERRKK